MHFDGGCIPESSGRCIDQFGAPLGRRGLLKAGGLGLGVLLSGGILRRPLASAAAAFGSPGSAEPAIEVQLFQTAASLENLAISTYTAALELPFVQENATVVRLHRDHDAAARRAPCALQCAGRGSRRRAAGGTAPQVLPNRRCVVADVDRRGRCSRVGSDARRSHARTPTSTTWPFSATPRCGR